MQNGNLHRFVNIYLNDEDIRYLDQLNTRLKEGDSISILPALAGGCHSERSDAIPFREEPCSDAYCAASQKSDGANATAPPSTVYYPL